MRSNHSQVILFHSILQNHIFYWAENGNGSQHQPQKYVFNCLFSLGYGNLNNLQNYMQFDLEVMNGRDGGILSQLTVLGLRKGYKSIGLFHYL